MRGRFTKPDALIMHSGPINCGVKIDSDIADSPQTRVKE
jgi:aspartate carbamoyltransferase catalytic subunit